MAGKHLSGRLRIDWIDTEGLHSTDRLVSVAFECSTSSLAAYSEPNIAGLMSDQRKEAPAVAYYWKQAGEVSRCCVGLAASHDVCATQ